MIRTMRTYQIACHSPGRWCLRLPCGDPVSRIFVKLRPLHKARPVFRLVADGQILVEGLTPEISADLARIAGEKMRAGYRTIFAPARDHLSARFQLDLEVEVEAACTLKDWVMST